MIFEEAVDLLDEGVDEGSEDLGAVGEAVVLPLVG